MKAFDFNNYTLQLPYINTDDHAHLMNSYIMVWSDTYVEKSIFKI